MTTAHAWTNDGTLGSADGYTGPICARCGRPDLPETPVDCTVPPYGPGIGYRTGMAGNINNIPDTGAPHKNADIICQWVRGAALEVQSPTLDTWSDVPSMSQIGDGNRYLEPSPIHPDYDYMRFRIKV